MTGAELAEARVRLGMKQAQLASLVGLNVKQIGRYECGRTVIPPRLATVLEANLGIKRPNTEYEHEFELVAYHNGTEIWRFATDDLKEAMQRYNYDDSDTSVRVIFRGERLPYPIGDQIMCRTVQETHRYNIAAGAR